MEHTDRQIGSPPRRGGRLLALPAVAAALLVALALPAPASAERSVDIDPDGLSDPTVAVEAGEAVHFTNRSGRPLTIAAADGTFASGEVPDGGGYSVAVSVPGAHAYTAGDAAGELRVRMTALPGPPLAPANDHVPDVLTPLLSEDDTGVDPATGMLVASRRLILSFAATTTVLDANEVLASVSADVIGADPVDGVLVVELAGELDLDFALAILDSSPAVAHVSLDPVLETKRIPRPAEAKTSGIGWIWDVQELPSGEPSGGPGIWGVQAARFPQAWNWIDAIKTQKPPAITTAIVDDGFDASHPDLDLRIETLCHAGEACNTTPPLDQTGAPEDHGNAMAGIIGARHDNPAAGGLHSIGMSGGNPFATMVGLPQTGFLAHAATHADWARTRQLFSRLLATGRDGRLQNLRVINFSIGGMFPTTPDQRTLQWWIDHPDDTCGPAPSGDDGTGTLPCTPNNHDGYIAAWAGIGQWARDIAERAADQNVVIVQAAGNESDKFCTGSARPRPPRCPGRAALIDGINTAPFAWASANWQRSPESDPILVVGAINRDQGMTSYSNSFGHPGDLTLRSQLFAPGGSSGSGLVMPTLTDYTFDTGGTSSAAAFVSAAAGYLLAYQPTLTTSDIRRQLETWSRPTVGSGTMGNRLDVFASLLGLPATDVGGRSLAAMRLLDVNDTSIDGNRRVVREEGGAPVRADTSAVAPDGRIDMRDFRRLRDAWLLACDLTGAGTGCPAQGNVRLDGSSTHRKQDLNLDSCVSRAPAPPPLDRPVCPASSTNENTFARVDFNGDGRIALDRAVKVPLTASGAPAATPDDAEALTDVGVLGALFDPDPRRTEGWTKASLPGLMKSGDLEIHGADLFRAGAQEIEINVRRPAAGDQLPTRRLKVGDRGIVVTAPVEDGGSNVRISAEAQLDGQTIEAVPEEVDLRPGKDIRVDLCQGLRLKAEPAAITAGGSPTKVTAVVRQCRPDDSISGKEVTFSVDPPDATLSAGSATTNGAGEATVDLSASAPGTYTVSATVELAEGRIARARLELRSTPKYTIAYHWRQELLDWSQRGTTRPGVFSPGWPLPPLPTQPDCTVPGTVDYCVDSFSIGPNTSDPADGLERKGVLSGSTTFRLDEEVLKSKHSSTARWTLSNPDGSDLREGSTSSRWGVLDPKQFWGQVMPASLHTTSTSEGVELHGLSAVADLGYLHYLVATDRQGAEQPTELHDAVPELLLIPRGDGSALKYGPSPTRPILFRKDEQGAYEPYVHCSTKVLDRPLTPGYLDPSASPYIPGGTNLGRKPVWAPGDRPMPAGPGTIKAAYAFEAVLVEGDAAPPVTLPDCSQNEPPQADFEYSAAELAEGRVVRFTDRSTDRENDLTSWSWDFGEGSTSAEQDPHHLFADDGAFTVTLKVTDGSGATASKAKTLTVANLPPDALFLDQTVQADRAQTIEFGITDPGSEDKKALEWRLTSDDGRFAPISGTDAAGNQIVTVAAPGLAAGEYPVTLTVTDKDGGTDVAAAQITVVAGDLPAEPDRGSFITCDPDLSLDDQEHEFLTLVNLYRTQNGLSPLLGVSPTLTRAAERHAHDMAEHGFMDHTGSDGSTPFSRARDANYRGAQVSENIASGLRTAAQAMIAWRASQTGHNENMVDPRWRAIGIARELGDDGWYWATSYGDELDCPAPAQFTARSALAAAETPTPADAGALIAGSAFAASEPEPAPKDVAVAPAAAPKIAVEAEPGPEPADAQAPSPAFVVSDDEPLAADPVTFTNRSRDAEGTPVAATIDFDDGSAAVELAPGEAVSHAFPDTSLSERYYVRVTATDDAGRVAAVERMVAPIPLLAPYLEIQPNSQVPITGRPYEVVVEAYDQSSWERAAGMQLTFKLGSQEVVAVTDGEGVATATLVLGEGSQLIEVTFAGDATHKPGSTQKWVYATVNHPPVAHAGGPYVTGEGGSLLLDGTRSSDEDPSWFDAIAAYEWDLDGDGAYDDAAGRLPGVLEGDELSERVCGGPCVPGREYPLSLRVTDSHGDRGVDAATVRFVADFDLLLGGETKTIVPGQSNSFAVTVIGSRSYDKPVTLSVSGLPAGVTASFSKNPITPTGVSVLTLTGAEELEGGTFPLRVSATDGTITKEVSDQLEVAFGLIPICYGRMTGVVRERATGALMAGVSVALPGAYGVTDASGRYVLDNVPLGWNNEPLSHTVSTDKPGYWPASGQAEAACGGVTRLDLELLDIRKGLVRGRVIDKETREPLPGADVLERCYGYCRDPAVADEDGRFELQATLGPDNSERWWSGVASAAGYWLLEKSTTFAEDRPGEVLYELVKQCHGKLKGGQVRYTNPDEPAAGALVEVYIDNALHPDYRTFTDADGRFALNVTVPLGYNNTPTAYKVDVSPGPNAPPGARAGTGFLRLEACEGESFEILYLPTPKPNYGSVVGHVTDEETGAPLANVRVTNCSRGCQQATTDADGAYRLDQVYVGDDGNTQTWTTVSTEPEGYYTGSSFGQVTANATSTIDIKVLRRRFAALDITVVDSVTGAPIPGARVAPSEFSCGVLCGFTDREGELRWPAAPLGSRNAPVGVTLSATATGYWAQARSTTLRADQTSTLEYRLQPECEPARVTGTVVNAQTQAPIEGAQISGGRPFPAVTDANGRFQIDGIRPSTGNNPRQVTLTASASGFFSQSKQITIFCGARIAVDFGSRTSKTGTIFGTVTDAGTGAPLPNAFVGTEFGETATTDAEGRYRIEDAPLGDLNADREWAVVAQPPGYKPKTQRVMVTADAESRLDFAFSTANEPPVAHGQTVTLDEDAPADFTIGGTDPDGDALTFHVMRWPRHGRLTGRLPDARYAPDPQFHGSDSFEFIVSDGVASSERATVDLQVRPVNDPPRAVDDRLEAQPDQTLRIPVADLLANDVEVDDEPKRVTRVRANHPQATAVLDGDHVVFTPPPGWSKPIQYAFLDYTITDEAGASSTAWVYIRVEHDPAAPQCADRTLTVPQGGTLEAALTCTDANGDALTYALVSAPATGTAQLAPDGTLRYTPPADFAGTTTLTFKARDGALDSGVATVTVEVLPGNEAPSCPDRELDATEDQPLELELSCTDPDGDALTFELVDGPAHGSLESLADGRYRYAPAPDRSGEDSLRYRAGDGGATSPTATVTIRVAPVNDAPEAADDAAETGQDTAVALGSALLLANDTDVDGDVLSVVDVREPVNGTVALRDGNVTFTPAAGFHGTAGFSYAASDGRGGADWATVTVTVRPAASDATPPTCDIVAQGKDASGRAFIRFRVQDAGTGLARHEVVYTRNADVVIGPYGPGATGPIEVLATARDASKSLGVTVDFWDLAGNRATCDPIVLSVVRAADQPQDETFTDVPQAESRVTIYNGDPGVRMVRLIVNGTQFKQHDLEDGEVRKFDVAPAMRPGTDNVITVRVRGKKGASALIVIADIP